MAENVSITASLCTYPGREQSVVDTVRTLAPQVDEVWVCWNGPDAPWFLFDVTREVPNLRVMFAWLIYGDLGSNGKFAFGDVVNGYHLLCDDDLLYPPDYAQTMIEAVNAYDRKALISMHGRRFTRFPVMSYYRGHSDRFRCLGTVKQDEPVHIGGAGVAAYHTDTIRFSLDDFPEPNMDDIWMSLKCRAEGVPIVVRAHREGWIKHSTHVDMNDTIFARHKHNDSKQTAAVNSVSWELKTA